MSQGMKQQCSGRHAWRGDPSEEASQHISSHLPDTAPTLHTSPGTKLLFDARKFSFGPRNCPPRHKARNSCVPSPPSFPVAPLDKMISATYIAAAGVGPIMLDESILEDDDTTSVAALYTTGHPRCLPPSLPPPGALLAPCADESFWPEKKTSAPSARHDEALLLRLTGNANPSANELRRAILWHRLPVPLLEGGRSLSQFRLQVAEVCRAVDPVGQRSARRGSRSTRRSSARCGSSRGSRAALCRAY